MLLDMSTPGSNSMARRPRNINVDFHGSRLLTAEENEIIVRECDAHNYVIRACGVVQLYKSAPSNPPHGRHDHWSLWRTGVAFFIKDNAAHGFYIRLFDMEERRFFWEQELFLQFRYEDRLPYFHVFEADDCMAGLNFANEDEARMFKTAVDEKLALRRMRMEERKRASQQPTTKAHNTSMNSTHSVLSNNNNTNGYKSKKDKKDKKKRISKSDIGMPTDFVHLKHVGLDVASDAIQNEGLSGFNLDELDNSLYERAGISRQELQNPEIQRVVRSVLNSQQVSDDAINRLTRRQPPPVPTRVDSKPAAALPPPMHSHRSLPPVPAHSNGRSVCPAPPKPNRVVAPINKPPPPIPQSPPPQAVQPIRLAQPPPPPPSSGVAPPPPPPPPPPPVVLAPPPPPPLQLINGGASSGSSSSGGGGGTRDALLEQIKAGKTLNRVEHDKTSNHSGGGDTRDALLEQIRNSKLRNLKPVTTRPTKPDAPKSKDNVDKELDGLAAALAQAIAVRYKAVQSEDSDSDESDVVDEDEWDD